MTKFGYLPVLLGSNVCQLHILVRCGHITQATKYDRSRSRYLMIPSYAGFISLVLCFHYLLPIADIGM